jgi:RNA-binding protein Musashi
MVHLVCLLNFTNSEESMRAYFEQFGEITECTVMRENQTGRSRGFGFLTFRDPKCVNAVMVKEHILDGKIVSPLVREPCLTPID